MIRRRQVDSPERLPNSQFGVLQLNLQRPFLELGLLEKPLTQFRKAFSDRTGDLLEFFTSAE